MRILVTGSSDGIGLATARELLRREHAVVLHGRPGEKLDSAARRLASESAPDRVDTVAADLASLRDVARMADEVTRRFPDLQVLILNAGVMKRRRLESRDGYELTFAVNHLAPMLLAQRLVPVLRRNAPARIVVVSSMVHGSGRIDFDDLQRRTGYDGMAAYSASKLANVYMTRILAKELDPEDVTVNALHPGVINTKLLHEYFGGGAPADQGAATSVFLATSPEAASMTGAYVANGRRSRSAAADSPDHEPIARRLWEESQALIDAALGV